MIPIRSLVEPCFGLHNDMMALKSIRRSRTSPLGLRYFSSAIRCRSISSNPGQQDKIENQVQSATDDSSSAAQREEKATETALDNETDQVQSTIDASSSATKLEEKAIETAMDNEADKVIMADSIDHMLSRKSKQASPSTSSGEKADESEQEDSLIDMFAMLSDVAKQLKVLQEHQNILIGENKVLKTKLTAAEMSIDPGSSLAAKDDSIVPRRLNSSKPSRFILSAKKSPKNLTLSKPTTHEASDEGDPRGMLQMATGGELKGISNGKAKTKSVLDGKHSKHHLSHLNRNSAAQIVSVTDKPITKRVAIAVGSMAIPANIGKAIQEHSLRKGDVLSVARIAAIQAVKKTSDIIPLCHSGLPISGVKVYIRLLGNSEDRSSPQEVDQSNDYDKYIAFYLAHKNNAVRTMIKIVVQVESIGRTGVEMEALTGATAGMLTAYDMCKSISKNLKLNVKLTYKEGGQSGTWLCDELGAYLRTRSRENPV